MKAPPESLVKNTVKKLLNQHGAYWLMPMTFGYGESGHPDFVGCVYGYFLGIETKATPKSKITVLQQRRLQEIKNSGGYAFIIHNENVQMLPALLDFFEAHPCPSYSQRKTP